MSVSYILWDSITEAYDAVLVSVETHVVPAEITNAVVQLGNSMATLLQTQWEDVGGDLENLIKVANEYNLPMDMHQSLNRLVELLGNYGLVKR